MRDRLEFDDLGWRGLWCYVTAAPPGTAIHHARQEGWTLGDHLAAEQLHELRKLSWRYTAMHFEGGIHEPFPTRIPRPGVTPPEQSETGLTWETAEFEDIVSPEVLALLRD